MMHALSTVALDFRRLRLAPHEMRRGLIAGCAWGVTLTAGLAALSALQCGGVCLPEVAVNAVLSFTAGIAGIGPVAAYGGRNAPSPAP